MPIKTAFKGEVKYVQILNERGEVDKKLGVPEELSLEKLLECYRWMVFLRRFDEKALALQRTGRLGTYGALIGQEATQVGAGMAMKKEDWLVPSFREQGLMMMKGVPGSHILAYWGGDERGNHFDPEIRSLPISIPVASQVTHGVGLAMALSYRKEKAAVLACVGDGGTSEGDFHESCNFAGVYRAPFVVLVQNNHWAISVPREKQTASKTIAQKALAYGIRGVQVDGNDVMGVFYVVKEALDLAREEGKATVVEAVTYRMMDHTTADDAKKYRDPKEVEKWKPKDPIARLDKFLRKKGVLNDKLAEEIDEEAREKVAKAVEEREAMGSPNPMDTFKYMYAEIPPHLQLQMKEMERHIT